jgi:UDP-glucuronate 4-epimerase
MLDFKNEKLKVLVTGAAGFIGFHLCKYLISHKIEVVGIDNLNSYYDVNLKYSRLKQLGININEFERERISVRANEYFEFRFIDICDREALIDLFDKNSFDLVCNLAAQAGVRYSIENPYVYTDTNISGFINILECCRWGRVRNLVYASTSSVYGLNTIMPLSEEQATEHPMTLYAATKKANEMMAHSYSHLYNLPTVGLRFFTVYGPYGRPDMALFKFTKAVLESKELDVYNNGQMVRDFTYVEDIVKGIFIALMNPPTPNETWANNTLSQSSAPFQIYNVGNSNPVMLIDYIKEIEACLGKEAKLNMLPMQMGDVPKTWAKIDKIRDLGYEPKVGYREGVRRFIGWYKEYYSIK